MRVLVVDDSEAVRARLSAMLRESSGVTTVHEAASAEEADAFLGVTALDVVVLDLQMPGKSGLELLPRVAALAARPIVVVLTNQASERHRRECFLLGADFFFDKSRHFDRVLEVVADPERARALYSRVTSTS